MATHTNIETAESIELTVLRRFFEQWNALHAMARGGTPAEIAAQRTTLQHFAQRLSDAATDVRIAQQARKEAIRDAERAQSPFIPPPRILPLDPPEATD
jgi:hypothetical protein